ncbi:MAG: CopG family transcriptional regulator [Terrisporobacter sp.]
MVTKVVKDDVIRVRVTKEQKEKLKIIAKLKGKNMSDILNVATQNEIIKFEEREKSYKKICDRAVATEVKIQSIRERLEERKLKNRKSFWRK